MPGLVLPYVERRGYEVLGVSLYFCVARNSTSIWTFVSLERSRFTKSRRWTY